MKNYSRGLIIWAVVLAGFALVFFLVGGYDARGEQDIEFSQLVQRV